MNMARKVSGYIKQRFFSGLVSSALSALMLACLLIVTIGSLIAWGLSWLTAVVILISLQVAVAFFALSVQNYYTRAASSRVEHRVTSAVRSSLQSNATNLSAGFEKQFSSAKTDFAELLTQLREELAPLVERQENRLTQINEESLRMHREVTYIVSQLRDADRSGSGGHLHDSVEDAR